MQVSSTRFMESVVSGRTRRTRIWRLMAWERRWCSIRSWGRLGGIGVTVFLFVVYSLQQRMGWFEGVFLIVSVVGLVAGKIFFPQSLLFSDKIWELSCRCSLKSIHQSSCWKGGMISFAFWTHEYRPLQFRTYGFAWKICIISSIEFDVIFPFSMPSWSVNYHLVAHPTFIVFVGEPGPLVIWDFCGGKASTYKKLGLELTHQHDSWDEPPPSTQHLAISLCFMIQPPDSRWQTRKSSGKLTMMAVMQEEEAKGLKFCFNAWKKCMKSKSLKKFQLKKLRHWEKSMVPFIFPDKFFFFYFDSIASCGRSLIFFLWQGWNGLRIRDSFLLPILKRWYPRVQTPPKWRDKNMQLQKSQNNPGSLGLKRGKIQGNDVPSGKLWHITIWNTPFLIGKSTNQMVLFKFAKC